MLYLAIHSIAAETNSFVFRPPAADPTLRYAARCIRRVGRQCNRAKRLIEYPRLRKWTKWERSPQSSNASERLGNPADLQDSRNLASLCPMARAMSMCRRMASLPKKTAWNPRWSCRASGGAADRKRLYIFLLTSRLRICSTFEASSSPIRSSHTTSSSHSFTTSAAFEGSSCVTRIAECDHLNLLMRLIVLWLSLAVQDGA